VPTHLAGDVGGLLEARPEGRFRAAVDRDVAGVAGLLRTAGLQADLPERRLETTVVFSEPEDRPGSEGPRILATAAVDRVRVDAGLLRSVAVAPEARGAGLGALAVAHAVRAAQEVDALYLFTEDASAFFAELGFHEVDRKDLPDDVATSEQAASCPDATAMRWSR
jgi:N-acetylglutamate synthase-like GNAT family acetyltransferase